MKDPWKTEQSFNNLFYNRWLVKGTNEYNSFLYDVYFGAYNHDQMHYITHQQMPRENHMVSTRR